MRYFRLSRAVRALVVVLIVSICVHLGYRIKPISEETKQAFYLRRQERQGAIAGKKLVTKSMHHDQQTMAEQSDTTGQGGKTDPDQKKMESTFHTTAEQVLSAMNSRYKYTHKTKEGVQVFWWHLRARLKKMLKANTVEGVDELLDDMSHQEKAILSNIQSLEMLDREWKDRTANELKDLIQRRLHRLQNPENCGTARKLHCSMGPVCGFGCQMHHVLYCLILAYGTGRTLVLNSGQWPYSRAKGWKGAFLPLSDDCESVTGAVKWDTNHDSNQVVSVSTITSLNPRPSFLPQAIPEEFADKLLAFHGHPFVWFAGQLLSYLLRPNEDLANFINQKKEKLGITKPFVGVHVSRTDKIGTEAAFHSLDEYMGHVQEWYKLYGMTHKIDKRRVFIATDDPSVIQQARLKYTEYDIYGDESVAESAQTGKRYSLPSLFGAAFDMYMLADSDYIVCTFSSNLCGLGYALLQTHHTDASMKYYSLDDIYYFIGQHDYEVRALYSHMPKKPGQLEVAKGDVIGTAGNEKDGTSKGKSRRTSVYGEYLSYKVEEIPIVAKFYDYAKTNN